MDQRHSKLGVNPKWSANADWSNQSGDEISTIPSWRNQSSWRITTTKTVERLSEQPKYRVKQQYEALLKKHAIEYTKLMKEVEDWKAAGNEKNEEFEANEKGWKETLEEIFSLVKELKGEASASAAQMLGFKGKGGKCRSLRSNPALTANRTKRRKKKEESQEKGRSEFG